MKFPSGAGAKFSYPQPGEKGNSDLKARLRQCENRLRVLVVDDDALFGALVCRMLKKVGGAAVAMSDPEEALRRVSKSPDEFDVIITDQIMPEKNGLDLAAAIRELRPDVPIILLTGNENFAPLNGENGDDISLCLSKPINMKVLAEAVRDVTAAMSYQE